MIAFAKSANQECPRSVQVPLQDRDYWGLKTVTDYLGTTQYEFLNRVVSNAVEGHLRVAEQQIAKPEKRAIGLAKLKTAVRKEARRVRNSRAEDCFDAYLRDEVRLRKKAEDL